MQKLTDEQAFAITGYTGVFCCRTWEAFHMDVEKRLGLPVFTHQFPALRETIREAYTADFLALIPND